LTLGIIPAHLWSKVKLEQFPLTSLNTKPVGSGPYEVTNITNDNSGIPQVYNLKPFKDFALGTPKIDLTLRFYNSDKELLTALENGEVGSASALSPTSATKLASNGQKILQSPLPRTFTVFLNQNHNQIFIDPVLRQALSLAVDRQKLIDDVLAGYGTPLNNALPDSIVGLENNKLGNGLVEAQKLLTDNNWLLNEKGELQKNTITKTKTSKGTVSKTVSGDPVSFTLATANISELKTAAQIIANNWAKLGIKVNLEFFEPADLNQEVIRPRRYDALLFGEVIGRDYDLYPFWHSSQRLDPGLNIAMYVNNKVDKLLEEIRESTQIKDLPEKYQALSAEISKDKPAVFLYQPDFLYAIPGNLKGVELPVISNSANRFSQIYKWYFKTDRVWSIFANFISYF
jgi:peptide/nickel transport system substrate-binding protein